MSEADKAPSSDDYLAEVITVQVKDLFVDHRYQRGVKKSSVSNLIANWNWRRFLPIIVAPRGGSANRFAVIDGQQRYMAAQELGITSLPAILIVARDIETEAEMFVGANTGASVGAGDRFKAEYLRHEPRSLEIAGIVLDAGFGLACLSDVPEHKKVPDVFTISAVSALIRIWERGYLPRVLKLVADSFGAQPTKDMTTGNVLEGFYLALRHLDRFEVEDEAVAHSLHAMDLRKLMEMGYERYKSMVTSRSIPGGIAAVIVEAYNHRKRPDQVVPPYDRSAARAMVASAGARAQIARGTLRYPPPQTPEQRSAAGRAGWAALRAAGHTGGKFRKVKG